MFKWNTLLKFLFVIYLCKKEAFSDWTLNVGTVLFDLSDIEKKCWTPEGVLLLESRLLMQKILPNDPLTIYDSSNVDQFINQAHGAVNAIRQIAPGPAQRAMMFALSDAIGGYMRSYILPLTKMEFYDGNVPYNETDKMYTFYSDLKFLLRTNGEGWMKPRNVDQRVNELSILKVPGGKSNDICGHLIVYRHTEEPLEVSISMPYFDDDRTPQAIFVPFRGDSFRDVQDPLSANILQKYYVDGMQCLLAISSEKHLMDFNMEMESWLQKYVVPLLNDEKLYSAFGGVNRVLATVKRLRSINKIDSRAESGQFNAIKNDYLNLEKIRQSGTRSTRISESYVSIVQRFPLLLHPAFVAKVSDKELRQKDQGIYTTPSRMNYKKRKTFTKFESNLPERKPGLQSENEVQLFLRFHSHAPTVPPIPATPTLSSPLSFTEMPLLSPPPSFQLHSSTPQSNVLIMSRDAPVNILSTPKAFFEVQENGRLKSKQIKKPDPPRPRPAAPSLRVPLPETTNTESGKPPPGPPKKLYNVKAPEKMEKPFISVKRPPAVLHVSLPVTNNKINHKIPPRSDRRKSAVSNIEQKAIPSHHPPLLLPSSYSPNSDLFPTFALARGSASDQSKLHLLSTNAPSIQASQLLTLLDIPLSNSFTVPQSFVPSERSNSQAYSPPDKLEYSKINFIPHEHYLIHNVKELPASSKITPSSLSEKTPSVFNIVSNEPMPLNEVSEISEKSAINLKRLSLGNSIPLQTVSNSVFTSVPFTSNIRKSDWRSIGKSISTNDDKANESPISNTNDMFKSYSKRNGNILSIFVYEKPSSRDTVLRTLANPTTNRPTPGFLNVNLGTIDQFPEAVVLKDHSGRMMTVFPEKLMSSSQNLNGDSNGNELTGVNSFSKNSGLAEKSSKIIENVRYSFAENPQNHDKNAFGYLVTDSPSSRSVKMREPRDDIPNENEKDASYSDSESISVKDFPTKLETSELNKIKDHHVLLKLKPAKETHMNSEEGSYLQKLTKDSNQNRMIINSVNKLRSEDLIKENNAETQDSKFRGRKHDNLNKINDFAEESKLDEKIQENDYKTTNSPVIQGKKCITKTEILMENNECQNQDEGYDSDDIEDYYDEDEDEDYDEYDGCYEDEDQNKKKCEENKATSPCKKGKLKTNEPEVLGVYAGGVTEKKAPKIYGKTRPESPDHSNRHPRPRPVDSAHSDRPASPPRRPRPPHSERPCGSPLPSRPEYSEYPPYPVTPERLKIIPGLSYSSFSKFIKHFISSLIISPDLAILNFIITVILWFIFLLCRCFVQKPCIIVRMRKKYHERKEPDVEDNQVTKSKTELSKPFLSPSQSIKICAGGKKAKEITQIINPPGQNKSSGRLQNVKTETEHGRCRHRWEETDDVQVRGQVEDAIDAMRTASAIMCKFQSCPNLTKPRPPQTRAPMEPPSPSLRCSRSVVASPTRRSSQTSPRPLSPVEEGDPPPGRFPSPERSPSTPAVTSRRSSMTRRSPVKICYKAMPYPEDDSDFPISHQQTKRICMRGLERAISRRPPQTSFTERERYPQRSDPVVSQTHSLSASSLSGNSDLYSDIGQGSPSEASATSICHKCGADLSSAPRTSSLVHKCSRKSPKKRQNY